MSQQLELNRNDLQGYLDVTRSWEPCITVFYLSCNQVSDEIAKAITASIKVVFDTPLLTDSSYDEEMALIKEDKDRGIPVKIIQIILNQNSSSEDIKEAIDRIDSEYTNVILFDTLPPQVTVETMHELRYSSYRIGTTVYRTDNNQVSLKEIKYLTE